MVLGYLLASSGLRVTVLERHADFFRDFRGDTIHPSTLRLLGELGIRDDFLKLPVSKLPALDVVIDSQRFTLVDFSTLPKPNNFLVLAPQWDFLNFLAEKAAHFPGFELLMSTSATDLIVEGGQVRGIRASGPEGEQEIRATLTVAADGRHSTLRDVATMIPDETGVPIDVLWFHLPKPQNPPPATLGYLSAQGMALTIDRGDYYQAGMVIRKGEFSELRAAGLDAFRERLTRIAPVLNPVVSSLTDWDQIKLLSVQINHLERWYKPGFICIGDAAHAMSPMFGVGVNYAIMDAVALGNAIADDLVRGTAPTDTLKSVQDRRMKPVREMQRLQRLGHRAIASTRSRSRIAPPWLIGLARRLSPLTRRFTARAIGLGFRSEHADQR